MCIFRVKNLLLLAMSAFIAGNLVLPVEAAAAFKLPDTGQTLCYNTTSNEPDSCSSTGQDGEFAINPMSYTVNIRSDCALNDALKCTVTDNNTGLTWQSYATSIYNWYQASGTFQGYSNPNPIRNICGEMSLGGYTDWRIPTRKELLSIVDYSVPEPGPTVNAASFLPTSAASYWSYNTASVGYMSQAWGVSFRTGKTATEYEYSYMMLRCVRGPQVNQSLTNNNDGTITDNNTGLMWQRGETGAKSWSDALAACNALSLANYTDWRLPNVRELVSILGEAQLNPTLNTTFFPNVVSSGYWSSTSSATDPDRAWLVNFSNGSTDTGSKSSALYSRCVRGSSVSSLAPPVVATTAISDITTTTATGGGDVTSGGSGSVSARGICWKSSVNPTTDDSCISGGTGTGPFASAINGLAPNTQYHVRAYATNTAWTTYGDDVIFTTSSAPPTVITAAVTSITATTASSGGNITSDGGGAVSECGVCWSQSANPTISDSRDPKLNCSLGQFTSSISGLSALKSYHVRAYATNPAGTSYGEDISFTTNLCESDVTRGGTSYGTIQEAITSGSGTEITAVARVFQENLSFTNSSALALNGGYACGFGPVSGVTTVHGTITIAGSGSITVSNVAVY
jgi:hypothetical protein